MTEWKTKRPRFGEGIRREIMICLLTFGAVCYDGFESWEDIMRKDMSSRTLKRLMDEEYVERSRSTGKKVYRLTDFENKKKDYEKYFTEQMIDYYRTVGIISEQNSGRKDRIERINALTEIGMMMYAADIGTTCEDKADIIQNEKISDKGSYYYSVIELRNDNDEWKLSEGQKEMIRKQEGERSRSNNSKEEIREDGDINNLNIPKQIKKKQPRIINTGACGLLTCESDDYIIYDTGNDRIWWSEIIENQFGYMTSKIVTEKRRKDVRKDIDKCIVFYKGEDILREIYEDIENKKHKISIMSVAYKEMYYLPYNPNGRKLLRIMTISGWKDKMKELYLKGYDKRTERLPIVCDGIKEEIISDEGIREGIRERIREEIRINKKIIEYAFLFCIADIGRLYKFLQAAADDVSETEYSVFCYDFQKEFVEAVAGDYVNIYVTSIDGEEEEIRKIEGV